MATDTGGIFPCRGGFGIPAALGTTRDMDSVSAAELAVAVEEVMAVEMVVVVMAAAAAAVVIEKVFTFRKSLDFSPLVPFF